jgi:hypothetical protein
MPSIMPPGYDQKARKRLEDELRQARASELTAADAKQRARIEKEIRAEVDKRFGHLGPFSFLGPVLWHH